MNTSESQEAYQKFDAYLARARLEDNGSLLLRDLHKLNEEDFISTYHVLPPTQRAELSRLLDTTDGSKMLEVYEILAASPPMIEIDIDVSQARR